MIYGITVCAICGNKPNGFIDEKTNGYFLECEECGLSSMPQDTIEKCIEDWNTITDFDTPKFHIPKLADLIEVITVFQRQ